MKDPVEFVAGNRNEGSKNVKHIYYMVKAHDKYLALKRIADNNPDIYGIIFCRTRKETQEIADKLIADGLKRLPRLPTWRPADLTSTISPT